MINIKTKTKEEIENEIILAKFSSYQNNHLCPTYIIKKDGTRIDICDLLEDEILELIYDDFLEFKNTHNSNNQQLNKPDSILLINELKKFTDFNPSIDFIIYLCKLKHQFKDYIDSIINIIDSNEYYKQAELIAKFQKESTGIYEDIQLDDIIAILVQMKNNIDNKNLHHSKK